jgi:hypothetical protein
MRPSSLPFLIVFLLAACGGEHTGTTSSGETVDAGPTVSCDSDPRVDTYVANLVKSSAAGMKVTLVASDPAPPIRGTNDWTLKVVDATGMPVTSDVTIVPFMPDHGHGTSVKPTLLPQPDGSWKVDNLYFFMPGVWRITVTHASDSVQFFFCVEG